MNDIPSRSSAVFARRKRQDFVPCRILDIAGKIGAVLQSAEIRGKIGILLKKLICFGFRACRFVSRKNFKAIILILCKKIYIVMLGIIAFLGIIQKTREHRSVARPLQIANASLVCNLVPSVLPEKVGKKRRWRRVILRAAARDFFGRSAA